jgi:hypothetical protein
MDPGARARHARGKQTLDTPMNPSVRRGDSIQGGHSFGSAPIIGAICRLERLGTLFRRSRLRRDLELTDGISMLLL